uniref:Pyrin domain-containing protein n=1 Tax=Sinocyclocheilus rhinocerous TaxID=307959 RepID=A0A673MGC6_9TELE
MTSVPHLLLDTLEGLDSTKLKKFKWHLKNDGIASVADVEKADATDTVELMVARRGQEGAVKITLDILRKMEENHLAEQLQDKHKASVSQTSS